METHSIKASLPDLGEGLQKSLCLLTYITVGFVLRPEFKKQPLLSAGIRRLIMNVAQTLILLIYVQLRQALLPCVTFKGLVGISLNTNALSFVYMSAAITVWLLISGAIANSIFMPSRKVGSEIPWRTSTFINATMAPGLSSFAFINEFGGAHGAGIASLMDIATKGYQLIVQPPLLRLCSPASAAVIESNDSSPAVKQKPLVSRIISAVFADNINVAILAGLAMSFSGLTVSDLGFVGRAILGLASAQTPVLFVLIGVSVQIGGDGPIAIVVMLLWRAASALVFTACANRYLDVDATTALVTTLYAQASASMLGYGIMSGVIDAQSKSNPAMNKKLAFDLVAYSMILTIFLNTSACIAQEQYTDNLFLISGCLAGCSCVLFLAKRDVIQGPATWTQYCSHEPSADDLVTNAGDAAKLRRMKLGKDQ